MLKQNAHNLTAGQLDELEAIMRMEATLKYHEFAPEGNEPTELEQKILDMLDHIDGLAGELGICLRELKTFVEEGK